MTTTLCTADQRAHTTRVGGRSKANRFLAPRRGGPRRSLVFVALLALATSACASAPRRLLIAELSGVRVVSLEEELANRPSSAPIAAAPLLRTNEALVQVVRIHGEETFHKHQEHDLIVFLVRGQGRMRLGENISHIEAGDVVVVQRGVPHAFQNRARDGSLAVVVSVPPARSEDRIEIEGERN